MPRKVLYLTRSDISWYSQSANAYQKPLLLSRAADLTILFPAGTTLPAEIAGNCHSVAVPCGEVREGWSFWRMARYLRGCQKQISSFIHEQDTPLDFIVATGFDLPCLLLGWWVKCRWGGRWFVFCWDHPAATWLDRRTRWSRVIVAGMSALFRMLVQNADRLILNIHPEMLGDLGYRLREKQLVCVPNGFNPNAVQATSVAIRPDAWRVGVLSEAIDDKGLALVTTVFLELAQQMPRLKIIWIGDVDAATRTAQCERLARCGVAAERWVFTGRLGQLDAHDQLAMCGVLLHPYLAIPSLKWNYPLKLVEYMGLGRAIVASDTPGVRAYIEDGVNGLLFCAGDRLALARALSGLLGNAKEQVRLGMRAQQDADKFAWPEINRTISASLADAIAV